MGQEPKYWTDGTDTAVGYGYPSSVPWNKVARFLADIGVTPIESASLAEVRISPQGLSITRHRVCNGDDGTQHKFTTGPSGQVASQVTTCRIDWE